MDTMPVVLIVKAPNQQIEDQTVHCELSWTIKKLKGYLSEVYPSKPRSEEQKLIYSGKLLHDSVVLRDVLRQYEGQETHTVHLVCTPTKDSFRRSALSSASKMSNNELLSRNQETVSGDTSSGETTTRSTPSTSEGMSQRLASPQESCSGIANSSNHSIQQPVANTPRALWTAAMSQTYAGYDPNNANTVEQLEYMQRAYALYISQYMRMMSAGVPQQSQYVPTENINNTSASQEQENIQPVVNPAEGAPANVDNNPDRDDDDEVRANPDFLDWFYFMSRLLVMFSIVYFYSSPGRFIMVSIFGVLMYLYQIGFFGHPNQPQRAVPLNNNNEPNNHDNNNENNGEQGTGEAAELPQQEVDRPTILSVTWTFFSSFFASLIPEQPATV